MIGGNRGKLIKGNETEQTLQNFLQTVGGDHDVVTKADKRERVEGDSHLGVGGDRSQLISGMQSLTVGGNQPLIETTPATRCGWKRSVAIAGTEPWLKPIRKTRAGSAP